jgi:hypothetical protein
MDPTRRAPGTDVVWAATINLVVAAWLIAAPQALGYADVTAALWNDIAVGAAVALIAGLRIAHPARHPWLSAVNLVLGGWLIAAPFVLGGGAPAADRWNGLVIGTIVAIEAGIGLTFGRRAAEAERRAAPRAAGDRTSATVR